MDLDTSEDSDISDGMYSTIMSRNNSHDYEDSDLTSVPENQNSFDEFTFSSERNTPLESNNEIGGNENEYGDDFDFSSDFSENELPDHSRLNAVSPLDSVSDGISNNINSTLISAGNNAFFEEFVQLHVSETNTMSGRAASSSAPSVSSHSPSSARQSNSLPCIFPDTSIQLSSLASFTPSDVLAFAWPLLSELHKVMINPPYKPLPNAPKLSTDPAILDDISIFLRHCALDMQARQQTFSIRELRCRIARWVAKQMCQAALKTPIFTSLPAINVSLGCQDLSLSTANNTCLGRNKMTHIDIFIALSEDITSLNKIKNMHNLVDDTAYGDTKLVNQNAIGNYIKKLLDRLDTILTRKIAINNKINDNKSEINTYPASAEDMFSGRENTNAIIYSTNNRCNMNNSVDFSYLDREMASSDEWICLAISLIMKLLILRRNFSDFIPLWNIIPKLYGAKVDTSFYVSSMQLWRDFLSEAFLTRFAIIIPGMTSNIQPNDNSTKAMTIFAAHLLEIEDVSLRDIKGLFLGGKNEDVIFFFTNRGIYSLTVQLPHTIKLLAKSLTLNEETILTAQNVPGHQAIVIQVSDIKNSSHRYLVLNKETGKVIKEEELNIGQIISVSKVRTSNEKKKNLSDSENTRPSNKNNNKIPDSNNKNDIHECTCENFSCIKPIKPKFVPNSTKAMYLGDLPAYYRHFLSPVYVNLEKTRMLSITFDLYICQDRDNGVSTMTLFSILKNDVPFFQGNLKLFENSITFSLNLFNNVVSITDRIIGDKWIKCSAKAIFQCNVLNWSLELGNNKQQSARSQSAQFSDSPSEIQVFPSGSFPGCIANLRLTRFANTSSAPSCLDSFFNENLMPESLDEEYVENEDKPGIPLLNIPIHEGVGCCIQDTVSGTLWVMGDPIKTINWISTIHVSRLCDVNESIYFVPKVNSDSIAASNGDEIVLLHSGLSTWIDHETGDIIEQLPSVEGWENFLAFCSAESKKTLTFDKKTGLLTLLDHLHPPIDMVLTKNKTDEKEQDFPLLKDFSSSASAMYSNLFYPSLSTSWSIVYDVKNVEELFSAAMSILKSNFLVTISSSEIEKINIILSTILQILLNSFNYMYSIGQELKDRTNMLIEVASSTNLHLFPCVLKLIQSLKAEVISTCMSNEGRRELLEFQLEEMETTKIINPDSDSLILQSSIVSPLLHWMARKDRKRLISLLLRFLIFANPTSSPIKIAGISTMFRQYLLSGLLAITSCSDKNAINDLLDLCINIVEESIKSDLKFNDIVLKEAIFPIFHVIDPSNESNISLDKLMILHKKIQELISVQNTHDQKDVSTKEVITFTERRYTKCPAFIHPILFKVHASYAKSALFTITADSAAVLPSVKITSLRTNFTSYNGKVEITGNTCNVFFDEGGIYNIELTPPQDGVKIERCFISAYIRVEMSIVFFKEWQRSLLDCVGDLLVSNCKQILFHCSQNDTSNSQLTMSCLRGGLIEKNKIHSGIINENSTLKKFAKKEPCSIDTIWRHIITEETLINRIEHILRPILAAMAWHMPSVVDSSCAPNNVTSISDYQKTQNFELSSNDLADRIKYIYTNYLRQRYLFLAELPQDKEAQERVINRALFLLEHIVPMRHIEIYQDRKKLNGEEFIENLKSPIENENLSAIKIENKAFLPSKSIAMMNSSYKLYSGRIRNQKIAEEIMSFIFKTHNAETMDSENIRKELLLRHSKANDSLKAYDSILSTGTSNVYTALAMLYYRELIYNRQRKCKNENAEITEGNYLQDIYGCGLQYENDLQTKFANIIISLASNIRIQDIDDNDLAYTLKTNNECDKNKDFLIFCALLCHPWNGADLKMFSDDQIFNLLFKQISKQRTDDYGILDLSDRYLAKQNSLVNRESAQQSVTFLEAEGVIGIQVENDETILLAKYPWIVKRLSSIKSGPRIYYFEVTFDYCTSGNYVFRMGIALNNSSHKINDDFPSFSISSEGFILKNKEKIETLSPFTLNVTIGCGIIVKTKTLFFTRNGEFLWASFVDKLETPIPFVIIKGKNAICRAQANFGGIRPFMYNFIYMDETSMIQAPNSRFCQDAALLTLHYLTLLAYKCLTEENNEFFSYQCSAYIHFLSKTSSIIYNFISDKENATLYNPDSFDDYLQIKTNDDFLLYNVLRIADIIILCCKKAEFSVEVIAPIFEAMIKLLLSRNTLWASWAINRVRCIFEILSRDALEELTKNTLKDKYSLNSIFDRLLYLATKPHTVNAYRPLFAPDETETIHCQNKGSFCASKPIPINTGVIRIGFRISRSIHEKKSSGGTPLGGCYYVGLSASNKRFTKLSDFLNGTVFVLEDTDDDDQVQHLLLPRGNIPRNGNRRVFGNGDIVWLELDPKTREITFYRNKNELIGLAFRDVPIDLPLYPACFLYNDDACCTLISSTVSTITSINPLSVLRSKAVSLIQHLHATIMTDAISEFVDNCLIMSNKINGEYSKMLIALAILSGEQDYSRAIHPTYGKIRLTDLLSNKRSEAIVEGSEKLVEVDVGELTMRNYDLPMINDKKMSSKTVSLISRHLQDIIFQASTLTPLEERESKQRKLTESLYVKASFILDFELVVLKNMMLMPNKGLVSDFFKRLPTFSYRLSELDVHPMPPIASGISEPWTLCFCPVIFNRISFLFSTDTATQGIFLVGITKTPEIFDKSNLNLEEKLAHFKPFDMLTQKTEIMLKKGILIDIDLFEGHQPLMLCEGSVINLSMCFHCSGVNDTVKDWLVFKLPLGSAVILCNPQDNLYPTRNPVNVNPFYSYNVLQRSSKCAECSENANLVSIEKFNVSLCYNCFSRWIYPREIFYEISEAVDYLVSIYSPKALNDGDLVEVLSSPVIGWEPSDSVNVDCDEHYCLSIRPDAYVISESLPSVGTVRCDFKLSSMLSTQCSSLCTYSTLAPRWKESSKNSLHPEEIDILEYNTTHFTTELPPRSFWFGINVSTEELVVLRAGLTTKPFKSSNTVEEIDAEMSKNDSNWGCFNDISNPMSVWSHNNNIFTLYIKADFDDGQISCAGSIRELETSPTVISSKFSFKGPLYFFLFASVECTATLLPGVVLRTAPVPSSVPYFALAPSCLPAEKIPRSFCLSPLREEAEHNGWTIVDSVVGELFYAHEHITIVLNHNTGEEYIYVNGRKVAYRTLPPMMIRQTMCIVLALPITGFSVVTQTPLDGRRMHARVTNTFSPDVAEVTTLSGSNEKMWIRRVDVRMMVKSNEKDNLKPGTPIALICEPGGNPSRATICSLSSDRNYVIQRVDSDTKLEVPRKFCFDLSMEDHENELRAIPPQLINSRASPPSKFTVGTRFNSSEISSFNGIMFSCKTTKNIQIRSLLVNTECNDKLKVTVFFMPDLAVKEQTPWRKIFDSEVMVVEKTFHICFQQLEILALSNFAFYINTNKSGGVVFFDEKVSGKFNQEMDSDGTISVMMGIRSDNSNHFSELDEARLFNGSIEYSVLTGYSQPYVTRPNDKSALIAEVIPEGNVTICRPLKTKAVKALVFTIDCVKKHNLNSLEIPILRREGSNTLRNLAFISVYHATTDVTENVLTQLSSEDFQWSNWSWIYAVRRLIDVMDGEINIHIPRCILEEGRNYLGISIYSSAVDLIACASPTYSIKNDLAIISNFAGKIQVSERKDVSVTQVFTPGKLLKQKSTSSYNGLMFDIMSKSDVIITEIQGISQTNDENVDCKLYFKEGSMERSEYDSSAWRLVSNAKLLLQENKPFSFGKLSLYIKANVRHALFLHTTNSSGLRFYKFSDGLRQGFLEQYDTDGTINVYVGKKCESDVPFQSMDSDPKAFMGNIYYLIVSSNIKNGCYLPLWKTLIVAKLMLCLAQFAEAKIPVPNIESLVNAVSKFTFLKETIRDPIMKIDARLNLTLNNLLTCYKSEILDESITLSSESFSMPTEKWPFISPGDYVINMNKEIVKITKLPKSRGHSTLFLPVHRSLNSMRPFHMLNHFATSGSASFSTATELSIDMENHELQDMDNDWYTEYLTKFIEGVAPHLPAQNIAEKLIRNEEVSDVIKTPQKIRAEHSAATLEGFSSVFKLPVSLILSPTVETVTTPLLLQPDGCLMGIQLTKEMPNMRILVDIIIDLSLRLIDDIICADIVMQIENSNGNLASHVVTKVVHSPGGMTQFRTMLVLSEGQCTTLANDAGHVVMRLDRIPSVVNPIKKVFIFPMMYWFFKKTGMLMSSISNYFPSSPDFSKDGSGVDCDQFATALELLYNKPTCQLTIVPRIKNSASKISSTFHVSVGDAMFNLTLKDEPILLIIDVTMKNGLNIYQIDEKREKVYFQHLLNIPWKSLLGDKHIEFKTTCQFPNQGGYVEMICTEYKALTEEEKSSSEAVESNTIGSNSQEIKKKAFQGLSSPKFTEKSLNIDYSSSHGENFSSWFLYDKNSAILINSSIIKMTSANGGCALGPRIPVSEDVDCVSFMLMIENEKLDTRNSLSGGHFAGVAVSSFDNLLLSAENVKAQDEIWAVQDIVDNNSITLDNQIDPLQNTFGNKAVLFKSSTQLYFTYTLSTGKLLLKRGDSSKEYCIFDTIPPGTFLRPFVRLPCSSQATLFFDKSSIIPLPKIMEQFTINSDLSTIREQCPGIKKLLSSLSEGARIAFEDLWMTQVNSLMYVDDQQASNIHLTKRLTAFEDLCQSLSKEGLFGKESDFPSSVNVPDNIVQMVEIFMSPHSTSYVALSTQSSYNNVMTTSSLSINNDKKCPQKINESDLFVLLPENCSLLGHCLLSNDIAVKLFQAYQIVDATLRCLPKKIGEKLVLNSMNSMKVVSSHPCIMKTIQEAAIAHPDYSCIVTNGHTTHSLSKIIEKKLYLNLEVRLIIIKDIFFALEHYHLHNIVFGCVVPENIYLRLDDLLAPKVFLWDAYRWNSSDSLLLPPETVTRGVYDRASEVWSAGVLALQILSKDYSLPLVDVEDRSKTNPEGKTREMIFESFAKFRANLLKEYSFQIIDSSLSPLFTSIFQMLVVSPPDRPSITTMITNMKSSLEGKSIGLSNLIENSPSPIVERSFRTGMSFKADGRLGSYHGIVFDVIAKKMPITINVIKFFADTTQNAHVHVYSTPNGFIHHETNENAWETNFSGYVKLTTQKELTIELTKPIKISSFSRYGIFLHTNNPSGVQFYTESDQVTAPIGAVQEENADIAVTAGRKYESPEPFSDSFGSKRYFKGTIVYQFIIPNEERSRLFMSCSGGTNVSKVEPCSENVPFPLGNRLLLKDSALVVKSMGMFKNGTISVNGSKEPVVLVLSEEPFESERIPDSSLQNGKKVKLLLKENKSTSSPFVKVAPSFPSGSSPPRSTYLAWVEASKLTESTFEADLSLRPIKDRYLSSFTYDASFLYEPNCGVKYRQLSLFTEPLNPVSTYQFEEDNIFYITQGFLRSGVVTVRFSQTSDCCVIADEDVIIARVNEVDSEWRIRVDLERRVIEDEGTGGAIALNVQPGDNLRIGTSQSPLLCTIRFSLDSPRMCLLSRRRVMITLPPYAESEWSAMESATPCGKRLRANWSDPGTVNISLGTLEDDDEYVVMVQRALPYSAAPVPLSSVVGSPICASPSSPVVPTTTAAAFPFANNLLSSIEEDEFEKLTGTYGIPLSINVTPDRKGGVRLVIELPDEEQEHLPVQPEFTVYSPSIQEEDEGNVFQQLLPMTDKGVVEFAPTLADNEDHEILIGIHAPSLGTVAFELSRNSQPIVLHTITHATETSPPPSFIDGSQFYLLSISIDTGARHAVVNCGPRHTELAPGELGIVAGCRIQARLSMVGATVNVIYWGKKVISARYNTHTNLWEKVRELFGTQPSPHFIRGPGMVTRHSEKKSFFFDLPPEGSDCDYAVKTVLQCHLIGSASYLLRSLLTSSATQTVRHQAFILILASLLPKEKPVAVSALIPTLSHDTLINLLADVITILSIPENVNSLLVDASLRLIEANTRILAPFVSINSFALTLFTVLFRAATIQTRSCRHIALRAICSLIESATALPPLGFFYQVSRPLLTMVHGLFRQKRTSSPLCHLSLRFISAIYAHFRRKRIQIAASSLPGRHSAINFPLLLCATDIASSLEAGEPLPDSANHISQRYIPEIKLENCPDAPTLSPSGSRPIKKVSISCKPHVPTSSFGSRVTEILVTKEQNRVGDIKFGWVVDSPAGETTTAQMVIAPDNTVKLSHTPYNNVLTSEVISEVVSPFLGVRMLCDFSNSKLIFSWITPDHAKVVDFKTLVKDSCEHFLTPFFEYVEGEASVALTRGKFKNEPPAGAFTLTDAVNCSSKASLMHIESPDERDTTCAPQPIEFYVECSRLMDNKTLMKGGGMGLLGGFGDTAAQVESGDSSNDNTAASPADTGETEPAARDSVTATGDAPTRELGLNGGSTDNDDDDNFRLSIRYRLLFNANVRSWVAEDEGRGSDSRSEFTTSSLPKEAGNKETSHGDDSLNQFLSLSMLRRDLVHFPRVVSFLDEDNKDNEVVDISALLPYFHKVEAVDLILLHLSPLVELSSDPPTPSVKTWFTLKRLATRSTRSKIFRTALNSVPRHGSSSITVQIHLLEARPSVRKGKDATLYSSIFFQLYKTLGNCPNTVFCCTPLFKVVFVGFGAVDAGGPYRETLTKLGEEMVTEHPGKEFMMNPLFERVGEEGCYVMPSSINEIVAEQQSSMLVFFGKLLAYFILSPEILPVDFAPLFWRMLLKEPLTADLLADLAPDQYRMLQPHELLRLHQSGQLGEIPEAAATLSTLQPQAAQGGGGGENIGANSSGYGFGGIGKRHPTAPYGRSNGVVGNGGHPRPSELTCATRSNYPASDFPALNSLDGTEEGERRSGVLTASSTPSSPLSPPTSFFTPSPTALTISSDEQRRLFEELSERLIMGALRRYEAPISFISSGLLQIIPLRVIRLMFTVDVERLVCGNPEVSSKDFKSACDDRELPCDLRSMFWQVVSEFTDEERSQLMQFITGQRRLPLRSKIALKLDTRTDGYPSSNTCFSSVRIPRYSSPEQMRDRLIYAMINATAIDADTNNIHDVLRGMEI